MNYINIAHYPSGCGIFPFKSMDAAWSTKQPDRQYIICGLLIVIILGHPDYHCTLLFKDFAMVPGKQMEIPGHSCSVILFGIISWQGIDKVFGFMPGFVKETKGWQS